MTTRSPAATEEFYAHRADPRLEPSAERRFSLAAAVRRHWLLTLLPVVVLAVAGVLAGAGKAPTYTATATINVGKSDIATQATPGYLTAAEALASSYSRLVTSQNIAVPAARKVGESPSAALSQLTAVPIPQEPTFTISASGSSSARAIALANGAVAALQHYAKASATQQGGPAQLLTKYQAAQKTAIRLQAHAAHLQAEHNGTVAIGHTVSQSKVTAAKVAAQSANLQAQALSNQYLNLSSNGVAPTLQVLVNPTAEVSTDRKTNMEKYGIIGAVGGLVIGIAFAGLTEGVAAGRRRRAAI